MVKVSKKPLISIIIPVYKVEKYLDRCIESVVNQTYDNLEIILIDDGSPDTCPKKCDEWKTKDKRIKVIHKKNGGLSDARNAGIKYCTGEYVGFVDSDDWIDSKMYEALYENMIKYDADISCCELARTSDSKNNEKIQKKYNGKIESYDIDDYMKIYFKYGYQKTVYYATTKLYKKNVLDNKQYPVGITSEDVLGSCKAFIKCKKVVTVNYPYYFYYENPESITGSKFSKNDLHLLEIWDRVVELCKKNKPEYIEMAKYNRNRIDYTLLMRMATQLSNKEIEEKYGKEKRTLLKRLEKNKKKLLKSPMPASRKITLQMLLINYELFVSLCKIVKKRR